MPIDRRTAAVRIRQASQVLSQCPGRNISPHRAGRNRRRSAAPAKRSSIFMARSDPVPKASRRRRRWVRAIHAAALNAGEWPSVLERLRARLDARVVALGRHEFATGSDSSMVESPDRQAFGIGMAEFSARNPWFLSSDDYLPGRVMTGDELISHNDLRRTDFYRGFLQPRGLLHLLCGVVDQRPRSAHVLSAYRAETQPPFDAREKSELASLLDQRHVGAAGPVAVAGGTRAGAGAAGSVGPRREPRHSRHGRRRADLQQSGCAPAAGASPRPSARRLARGRRQCRRAAPAERDHRPRGTRKTPCTTALLRRF